jgi:malate permease and related proteins
MNVFFLIFACLALGILVKRFGSPPPGLVPSLNWWVLNVALPALVLQLVPRVTLNLQLWFLPAALWFVFLGGAVCCALLGQALKWPRPRIGALILVAGLSNSAFTGYPLVEALRGKDALGLAAVADQLGAFPAMVLGGITTATWYAGNRPQLLPLLKRIVTFPPFLALFAGLIAGRFGGWPEGMSVVLDRVGSTLAPLAVFSVGLQFTLRLTAAEAGATAFALAWKLAVASLLILAAGRAFGVQGPVLAVAVLQAGMSPMISAAIIADQHGLDPRVTNATVGVGILLSLATVPLLNWLV